MCLGRDRIGVSENSLVHNRPTTENFSSSEYCTTEKYLVSPLWILVPHHRSCLTKSDLFWCTIILSLSFCGTNIYCINLSYVLNGDYNLYEETSKTGCTTIFSFLFSKNNIILKTCFKIFQILLLPLVISGAPAIWGPMLWNHYFGGGRNRLLPRRISLQWFIKANKSTNQSKQKPPQL